MITPNKLQSIDRTSRRHTASARRPEAIEGNDPVDNLVDILWINRKPANHSPLTRNMDALASAADMAAADIVNTDGAVIGKATFE
ncbi:MAG: hypothetical protein OXF79_23485 [Chloroflexi bacterium]|nr:hypothetical protein [Chloroflexota bacterium]